MAAASPSRSEGEGASRVGGGVVSSRFPQDSLIVHLAKQIQADLARDRTSSKPRLDRLLDLLLHPTHPWRFDVKPSQINEIYPCPTFPSSRIPSERRYSNIDLVCYIICRGKSMAEFKDELAVYDDSTVCGRVWTHNFLAYRCKTCGLSPCMSLCAECFRNSDHAGHDYNMFRSQAGGACDCGDANVLLPSGFCARHGRSKKSVAPPENMLAAAREVLPRFLMRLAVAFRKQRGLSSGSEDKLRDYDLLVSVLEEFCLMGQAFRRVITESLLSEDIYAHMTAYMDQIFVKRSDTPTSPTSRLLYSHIPNLDMNNPNENYKSATDEKKYSAVLERASSLDDVPFPVASDAARGSKLRLRMFPHRNFLQEIMFWTFEFHIPESLTTFLLNLLPDNNYKLEFTRVFLRHYPAVTVSLLESPDAIDAISNHVVHMSVQLFSNESLALEMVLDEQLLDILLACMLFMLRRILVPIPVFNTDFHEVVNVELEVVRKHCYWPIFSDFINLLAHKSVIQQFLSQPHLCRSFARILNYFSGMNGVVRMTDRHVEYESSAYVTAFSVEIETCAGPLSALVSNINHSNINLYIDFLTILYEEMLDQADAIIAQDSQLQNLHEDHVSFHWPLHRFFITLLGRVMREEGEDASRPVLAALAISENNFKYLMFHPLHVLLRVNEVLANLWVRNGVSIVQQVHTYLNPHFSHSFIDPDLLFLQVAAAAAVHVEPSYLLGRMLAMQTVQAWFTVNIHSSSPRLREDIEVSLVEGCLRLVALLANCRVSTGITDAELCRSELMAALAVSDRPHSQLTEVISEKVKLSSSELREMMEPVVELLAVFQPPALQPGGAMRQGMYTLTLQSWLNHFDPLHTSLRSARRSDYQKALQRYGAKMLEAGYTSYPDTLWPPFLKLKPISKQLQPLLRILESRTLHAMLFTVFYRAVYQTKPIPESLLALAFHLLSLCLDHVPNIQTTFEPPEAGQSDASGDGDELQLGWFSTNNIVVNMVTLVGDVTYEQSPPVANANDVRSPVSKSFHGSSSMPARLMQARTISESADSSASSSSTSPKKTKWQVFVNEDMLSLVLKVHNKLSCKPYSAQHLAEAHTYHHNYGVGDAAHHIKLLLSRLVQMSKECEARLRYLVGYLSPPDATPGGGGGASKASASLDFQERKKRAKAKNQALMKSMQQKQNKFLQDNYESVVSSESQVEADGKGTHGLRCIICNQATTDVQSDYLVIMGSCQHTNVLSKRVCLKEGEEAPDLELWRTIDFTTGQVPGMTRAADLYRSRVEWLEQISDQRVPPLALDALLYDGGSLDISLCNHLSHDSCLTEYKKTLAGQHDSAAAEDLAQLFSCPVCRKKCNIALPLLHSPNAAAAGSSSAKCEIPPRLLTSFDLLLEESHKAERQSEEMRVVDIDVSRVYSVCAMVYQTLLLPLSINGSTIPAYSPNPDSDIPKLKNLVLNLQRHVHLLKTPHGVSKDLGLDWTAPYMDSFMNLLVNIVNDNISLEDLDNVIRMHLEREIARKLVAWSYKLSKDERDAWKTSSHQPGSTLQLAQRILATLCDSPLFDDTSRCDSDLLDSSISAVIWSSRSVEHELDRDCWQFLQLCSMLKSRLLEIPSPPRDDVPTLLTYLNLPHSSLLAIDIHNVDSIMTEIVSPIAQSARKLHSHQVLKGLISSMRMIGHLYRPCLMALPEDYDSLFAAYRDKKCGRCGSAPVQVAACLICGDLICFQEKCCHVISTTHGSRLLITGRDKKFEATVHAMECGLGVGVMLLLNTTQVVVIHNHLAAVWGHLHLDSFGEEDRELKRGKPLFLSTQRYSVLNSQWARLDFDSPHLQWFNHNYKL